MSDMSPTATLVAKEPPPVLGYWHFVWMFFMQPIKLNQYLKDTGVDDPNESFWQLRHSGKLRNEAYICYLLRSAFVAFVATPLFAICLVCTLESTGIDVLWAGLAFGLVTGFGVTVLVCMTNSIALGVAFGVAGSLVVGMVMSVILSLVFDRANWVTIGGVIGAVLGTADSVAFVVGSGVATGVTEGVAAGLLSGLALCVATVMAFGMPHGVAAAVGFGGGVVVSLLRIHIWLLEVFVWLARFIFDHRRGSQDLNFAPIWYHELSYFPFPGICSAILDLSYVQAQKVALYTKLAQRIPGQRGTVAFVTAELWARQLREYGKQQLWSKASRLDGQWFPSAGVADAVLLYFRDVALLACRAQSYLLPLHRKDAWQKVWAYLAPNNIPKSDRRNRAGSAFAKYHAGVLAESWRQVIMGEMREAEVEASECIPNPFSHTPQPLGINDCDSAVFLGREMAIADLQRMLNQPQAALGILGPRRVGKSSLLRRLPLELQSDVFVYFDLQDNPVDSPAEFFAALAKRFEEAVLKLPVARRDFPRLREPSTTGVAAWFEALDGALNQRVVFCIDEYERLETLWSGDDRSLLQFMGLLRATIQHRRWVRVLIAGSAGPEELGRLWTDHFISVQEVRLDFLTEEQTLKLLCQDTPGFPGPEALPLEIGRSIYRLTSGQPFLTQVFGFLLVQALNEDLRKVATEADVAATRVKVLGWVKNYFGDERLACEQRSPATLAAIMALAKDEPLACDGPTRRWLRLRGMINEANQLRVELFKDYLRRRLAEEG